MALQNVRLLVVTAILGVAVAWLSSATPAAAAERYIDEVFPSVTVTSNIMYGQAIDEFGQLETLRLDVYQPSGDTLSERPAVIFVHGGGFTGGSKTTPSAVDYATRMAKRGFVTASINYRLREAGYSPAEQAQVVLDAQHDAQAAVRWFRANAAAYDIDADRISIAGYSAGAVTALFVAYNSGDPGDSGNPGYPSTVSAVISVAGNVFDPLIDAGEPPAMLVHGTADSTVPYSGSTEVVARAAEVGITTELHPFPGEGHSIFGEHMTEITQWSGEFLLNYVIGGSAVGGFTSLATANPPPNEGSPEWVWWLIPAALLIGPAARWLERSVRRRSNAQRLSEIE
ncbi:MAG: alpha/beta hydrolase [Dehalococcoidia bacterium]